MGSICLENVVLQIDLLRNRILKFELILSISSFVITCGALVTGKLPSFFPCFPMSPLLFLLLLVSLPPFLPNFPLRPLFSSFLYTFHCALSLLALILSFLHSLLHPSNYLIGLFGMNLLNHFELHGSMFYAVTGILCAAMAAIFRSFTRYAKREKLF